MINIEPIILIGGGGHCKAVIDVIESTEKYEIEGIIDLPEKVGTTLLGYPIIGQDADLERLIPIYKNVVVTSGMIKSSALRRSLFKLANSFKAIFPAIVSSNAMVSKHAKVGTGSVIMHQAIINAGAIVGSNCIINTKALIEHDARIGNHAHVSTSSVINGGCNIGESVMVGSNAVVIQNKSIVSNTIIGAGAVVSRDITIPSTYVGNPAKPI